jgi:microcin C transport system substrate-binding protein
LWNFFVIPHYHIQTTRIAYWNKFGMPDVVPPYGIDIDAWWIDPRKAAAVAAGKATLDAE